MPTKERKDDDNKATASRNHSEEFAEGTRREQSVGQRRLVLGAEAD